MYCAASPHDKKNVAIVAIKAAHRARTAGALGSSSNNAAAAVAGRIGSAPDALYPRLMASALGAVIEVSLQQWLRAPEAQTLREILEQAFERMGHVADRAG